MEVCGSVLFEERAKLYIPNKKAGILGGTFNPPHNGHADMLRRVREEFSLDAVYLMPDGRPPHKHHLASPEDRLMMTRLLAGEDIGVLDTEVANAGISYTCDTLSLLHERFKHTDFYFVIGSDTLFLLPGWKNFSDVLLATKFICVHREGCDKTKTEMWADRLNREFGAEILLSNYTGLPVSSTLIRERVRQGKSIAGFVPQPVEDYIIDKGLYRES